MQSVGLSVLHVTESYGAGVASALQQYVHATPEISHHLLRNVRPDFVEEEESNAFSSVAEFGPGLAAIRQLRRTLREVKPDIVHAHSSLGGLLVRTALRNRHPAPIVYTPHGYAFERLDVSATARAIYRLVEWTLSWNTELIVACSLREEQLSTSARSRRGTLLVPNVPPVDVSATNGIRRPLAECSTPRVVGAGRIAPAKDPAFLVDVLRELVAKGRHVRGIWIGDGSEAVREQLEQSGVTVTGWRSRREALELMASASVYVHSSAWDSGPMTLLEVSALGVPAVARRTSSLPDLPPAVSDVSPGGVADKVSELIAGGARIRERNVASWRSFFEGHTPSELRRMLTAAYEAVLVGSHTPARPGVTR